MNFKNKNLTEESIFKITKCFEYAVRHPEEWTIDWEGGYDTYYELVYIEVEDFRMALFPTSFPRKSISVSILGKPHNTPITDLSGWWFSDFSKKYNRIVRGARAEKERKKQEDLNAKVKFAQGKVTNATEFIQLEE